VPEARVPPPLRLRGSRSLAGQLAVASAVLVVVSLGVLSVLSVTASRRFLREQVLAANLTVAALLARAVDAYVTDAVSIAVEATGRPKLHHEIASGNWPEATRVLENVRRHFEKFEYVFVQSPDGVIRARVPPAATIGRDFSFRPFFREAVRTRKAHVSDAHVSEAFRRPVVAIAAPVLEGEAVLGVFVGALSLDAMSRFVAAVRPEDGGYAYIVDRRGVLVAHSGQPQVTALVDMSAQPAVRAAMGGRSGTMEFAEAGSAAWLLGAYVPVPRLGWSVVAAKPASVAYAPVERLLRWLVGLALACTGAAGILGWTLARRLARPLSRITAVAGQLAAGDLGARTGLPAASGEIGQLASAFDRMATSLESRRAEADQRRHEAEVVAELTRSLTASLDIDVILPLLVEAMRTLCRSDLAGVALREPDSDAVVFRYEAGVRTSRAGLRIEAGKGLMGRVLATGRPVRTADYARDASFTKDYLPTAMAESIVASMAVPIVMGGRAEGVLAVDRRSPHPFTDDEEDLLRQLAAHAAIAIGNARLHAEAEQRRRAAEALAEEVRRLNLDLERRVAGRTSQLEAVNRELEAFTYTVSHDLKAPLRGMEGYARAVIEDYGEALDATGRRYLETIQASARRMGELIEDLLRYSRLERREMRWHPVPLRPLLDELCAELEAEIRARGLAIRWDLDVDTVHGEREGLREALAKLVGNAVKFSRRDGGVITLAARRTDDTVVLSVRDEGIGFDMRYHDRIFRIFERLQRDDEYPGTGVGLAIVRKVAERHGGRAWAESGPGRGSTFHLALPANPNEGPAT
jgi:signal transduction histidine kinase